MLFVPGRVEGAAMAKKLDPKETVSFEELLMSNVIEQEALIPVLWWYCQKFYENSG